MILFSALWFAPVVSTADLQNTSSQFLPLNDSIALEITTISFSVPQGNTLPWGYVEGTVSKHVEDYSTIIHIFKDIDNDSQISDKENVNIIEELTDEVTVNKDGTYEYKFRIIDQADDVANIFEGDYTVEIYKTVYYFSDLTSA